MIRWLDTLPWAALVVGALLLGLAPFHPEPHLWEKLKLLAAGELVRPMDVFDLVLHAAFPVLLALKLLRAVFRREVRSEEPGSRE